MYKIFNTYSRETTRPKFLSRDNANDEALYLSEREYGNLCVIDEETGMVSDIWADGECIHSAN